MSVLCVPHRLLVLVATVPSGAAWAEAERARMATSGVCDSRGAAGSATSTHTPVSLQDLDPDTMLRVASLLDAPDVAHCVGVRNPHTSVCCGHGLCLT